MVVFFRATCHAVTDPADELVIVGFMDLVLAKLALCFVVKAPTDQSASYSEYVSTSNAFRATCAFNIASICPRDSKQLDWSATARDSERRNRRSSEGSARDRQMNHAA